MSTKIFVNLPTEDLERSQAFYTALGCDINPLFTDENAASVVWDDQIYFMILTREFFASFTDKKVADTRGTAQAILASRVIPEKRWIRYSPSALPLGVLSHARRRIMASCTHARWKTQTETSSSFYTWRRQQLSRGRRPTPSSKPEAANS